MRRSPARSKPLVWGLALLAATLLPGVARAQSRIVSAGGDVTEIIYDLGAGNRLIGRDSTSTYPEAAQALPDIGYMRRLSAEPILALHPDLLIAATGAGPETVFTQLQAAGLRSVQLEEAPGLPGVIDKVRRIAHLLGRDEEGVKLIDHIETSEAALQARLAHVSQHPRVLVLLSGGHGALLAAGSGTAGDAILGLAGAQNAVSGFTGYKPLTAEIVSAAAPDAILVPAFALPAMGGKEGLLAQPDLAASPAAHQGRVIVIDGLLLLGFGPRTPEAAATLAAALHPDLPPAP